MNVFRISVIVLALSLIAGAVVHIRLGNWHYGYLINQQYDQYQRIQRTMAQDRLEVAHRQNPDNLLGWLREKKTGLEGLGLDLTPTPTPAPTSRPAKDARTKEKVKNPVKKPVKRNPAPAAH